MDEKNINSEEQDIIEQNEINEIKPDDKSKNQKSSKSILKSKEKRLAEELDLMNQKNEELKDKFLRIVAEYDNFRKRTAKEKIDLRESAKSSVILDFIPVIDDMDRAMAHLDDIKDIDATVEGIKLIYQKFTDFLKSQGVQEIEALNTDFDLDFHEAVTRFPADEDNKGKVIDIVQKGYKLNDKVIRYSKVVVGE